MTLSKSAKTIPVMAMGRLMHGRKNSWNDYLEAAIAVAGIFGFMATSASDGGRAARATTTSGVVLLVLYLLFDAFQSQWQSGLFRNQRVGQMEMMRSSNAVALALSLFSTFRAGEFGCASRSLLPSEPSPPAHTSPRSPALSFIAANPTCRIHLAGCPPPRPRHVTLLRLTWPPRLAATGAIGQIFIFRALEARPILLRPAAAPSSTRLQRFGPVVFTMIMASRQLFSVLV